MTAPDTSLQTNSELPVKQKTDNQPAPAKPKSTPTLSLWMTKTAAIKEGGEVLELFNKYNTNSGTTDYIDDLEFAGFVKGKPIDIEKYKNFDEEKLKDISKLPTKEQFNKVIDHSFEALGIRDEIKDVIADMKNNPNKKDTITLAKEQLGLDLSQYKTEEEKQNAIAKAINNKYAANLDNKDSVYAQHYERLKRGELTESEKKLMGGRTSINDEKQLQKFAEMATNADAIVEISKFFAAGDTSTQETIIKTIGQYNENIQTGVIGAAIMSANDKETRKHFTALLRENPDLKLTDRNQKLLNMATYIMHTYSTQKESMEFVSNRRHFGSPSTQTSAYMMSDVAERAKVERGELTQEEYDANYVNVYAAAAHKMEEASKAYDYVIKNSNDTNRQGAMDMLASTAYNIQNESERNKAIGNLKGSEYFNDQSAEKLNEGFNRYLSNKVQNNYSLNQTNPIKNGEDNFSRVVSDTFNGNDEDAKLELINTTFNNLNEKNTTPKRAKMNYSQGVKFLNTIIKEGKLQNSPYEEMVLSKLKSLSPSTLLNLVVGLSAKTQNYFLENGIIEEKQLAKLNEFEKGKLSNKLHKRVDEYVEEKQQLK